MSKTRAILFSIFGRRGVIFVARVTMGCLLSSLQASGGNPPPPEPEHGVVDNFEQGGGGNVAQDGQEVVIFAPPATRDMLSDLPLGVLSNIASFLPIKDRLSLSLMSRTFLKAVEISSKEALDKLRERADETWHARISNQDSIQTDRPKPLELPFRYLCSKALNTHLYHLGGCYHPLLMPDGKSLIGTDGFAASVRVPRQNSFFSIEYLCMWDIEVKKNKIFQGNSLEFQEGLLLAGDLVVTSALVLPEGLVEPVGLDRLLATHAVLVHNHDGQLIHAKRFAQGFEVYVGATNASKAFLFRGRAGGARPVVLDIMDLSTFQVQEKVLEFPFDPRVVMLTVGDFLIVIGRKKGIYVYDTRDFRQTCYVEGKYYFVQKSGDGTTIVAATRDHSIDVFDFGDGRLSRRSMLFRKERARERPYIGAFLSVHDSLVCVTDFGGEQCEVYDIGNGMLVRTIALPNGTNTCGTEIVTNGHELFFPSSRGVYVFPHS